MSYAKLEAEYQATKKELSEIYLRVSKYYARMSKVSDEHSYLVLQSGIENDIVQAGILRGKLEVIRKRILTEWDIERKK